MGEVFFTWKGVGETDIGGEITFFEGEMEDAGWIGALDGDFCNGGLIRSYEELGSRMHLFMLDLAGHLVQLVDGCFDTTFHLFQAKPLFLLLRGHRLEVNLIITRVFG